jgi:hypothetical protein
MKRTSIKENIVYLFSIESSDSPHIPIQYSKIPTGLQTAKVCIWITIALLTTLVIGQLG